MVKLMLGSEYMLWQWGREKRLTTHYAQIDGCSTVAALSGSFAHLCALLGELPSPSQPLHSR